MGDLDGVLEVDSDISTGLFFVRLADDAQLSVETVRTIVTNAGFTLRSFEEVAGTTDKE